MSNDFSYPGDYAAGQSDNMEMSAFFAVGQPYNNPASNEIPTQHDPHGAGKEKRTTKTSMLMTNSSVSLAKSVP
jgi:hypothetical protein